MDSQFVDELQRSWLKSLIGIALFAFSIWLLTTNEGSAVHHAQALEEAYNNVIPLNSFDPIRSELEGRLVHVTGSLTVDEPLTDPEYGIAIQAVKVKRRVQMYQWVERDSGAEIVDYYYVREWRDKLVSSVGFYIRQGHENPTRIPLKSLVYTSHSVKVGQLALSSKLKDKFDDFVEVTSDERPERKDIKLHLGIYYHCDDVWNPEVGDIRVQFYYAGLAGEPVSIVAKQENGMLVPYVTSKGHEIALLRRGIFAIPELFTAEYSDTRIEIWKIRGLGFLLLFLATENLSRLIRILLFRSPMFRRMFATEITLSSNFIISFSVWLFIIASAWMFYRPMLGFGLFMASVSPFLYSTIGFYNIYLR